MKKNDLTIMVLGLPDCELFESDFNLLKKRVKNYRKYGKVIITKYKHVDPKYYEPFISKTHDGISLIEIEDRPESTNKIHPKIPNSFPHQVNNTLQTLKQVNTPYVLKIRYDEYYENLQPLINLFLKDTKKFVSNNMGWSNRIPSFVNDHIFIGKTDLLLKTYKYMGETIKNNEYDVYNYSCEYILYKCFLSASTEEYPKTHDETLFDRFDCIDVREFGKFLYSCTSYPNSIEQEYKHPRWTDVREFGKFLYSYFSCRNNPKRRYKHPRWTHVEFNNGNYPLDYLRDPNRLKNTLPL
jgi:hypothetical protein